MKDREAAFWLIIGGLIAFGVTFLLAILFPELPFRSWGPAIAIFGGGVAGSCICVGIIVLVMESQGGKRK